MIIRVELSAAEVKGALLQRVEKDAGIAEDDALKVHTITHRRDGGAEVVLRDDVPEG